MPYRSAILVWLLISAPLFAQPKTGDVQPDRLDIGVVYIGATVEASFMVMEAGNDAKTKLEVAAPKFVKVLDKSVEARDFGPGNNFVCGSIEIAIDTEAAAEFYGEVEVTLGKTKAKLPISATVKARRPGLSRVLIAETPFERYTTKDGAMFKAWTDLVKSSPLDVCYLLTHKDKPVLRDLDLNKFDCVFLPAGALYWATAEDIKKARKYAEGGGRVVVAANAFFVKSVTKANEVLDGYGLAMRDDEARGGVGVKDVILGRDDLDPKLVKSGVTSAHFFRASPAQVTDPKKGQILARAVGVGEAGDGFVALAAVGKGEMIAIGQSLWWNWICEERAKGTDNAKFLRWLLVPRVGG
jgi:hypothetical protein